MNRTKNRTPSHMLSSMCICVTICSILVVNSDQFQILQSYTLLLKLPVLAHSCPFYSCKKQYNHFLLTKLQVTESRVGDWGRGFVLTCTCTKVAVICTQCTHSHPSQRDTSYLGNTSTHPDVQSHTNLQPDGTSC